VRERSSHAARVLKVRADALDRADDQLATEEPLEVRLNGEPLTVIMRTPGHDQELVSGFLYGEGMIRSRDDLLAFDIVPNGEHLELENIVDVRVSRTAPGRDARWQRHFLASSSCGVCGVSTLEAIHHQAPPLDSDGPVIPADVLTALDPRLRAAQAVFHRTGGLHAAGLFTVDGQLVVAREDIGRHNAVDKVVGHALRAGSLPLNEHILLVSGRTSFEIMQKALQARIPIVASVSAPSSLARDLAQASNQTLIGFLRGQTFNVYSGRQRVRAEPARHS
jgi:FdhD protein